MGADDYQVIDFPASRLATADVGRYGLKRHSMWGLLEVDVTRARSRLRELRRAGVAVSFTAWMVKTIGDSVAANPLVHALRGGRRRLIAFADVDIGLPVEREVDGTPVPLALLLRAANRRTAAEIHREIQAAVERPISDERDYILGGHPFSRALLRLYYALPPAVRLLIWRGLFGNPFRARRLSGTVVVTTVNAVGGAPAWILPGRTMHNLSISIGAVTRKPWAVGGAVALREILCLTVAFDHDVIDGMPARRFMQDLVRRIEAGAVEG
jgi:hypothetical protein